MNIQRPTPAIVSQSAVRALPRPVLWAVMLVYLCAGFIGRHPWKNEDMAAYGYMQALAQGQTTWLAPHLVGQPLEPAVAVLPVWLGALALQISPAWLDPQLAVRLPFMALLMLAFAATWYATYYLARRPAAQPVPFAFGGEARPADYARAIADGSVLALIACFGLIQFSHEAAASVVQLFGASLLFMALAMGARKPDAAELLILFAVLVLFFSGAGLWVIGACTAVRAWMLCMRSSVFREMENEKRLLHTAFLAVMTLAIVGFVWNPDRSWPSFDAAYWQSLWRVLIWFGWPAWPLMCWAVYRWRAHIFTRQPAFHLLLPLGFLLGTLLPALLASNAALRDRLLFLGLPMAATLAAFALPTLKRGVSAAIDWFTMLFFTASGIAIWVIWTATQTGTPAKPAANVAKLAPDYVPVFSPLAFALALLATVVWLAVVVWRTGRHQAALWKSLVLPAGGATWCLVLVMTLWLPMLDYGRSYTAHIDKLREHIGDEVGCIWPYGLSRAQLAAFAVQAGWPLQDPAASHSAASSSTPTQAAQTSTQTPAQAPARCKLSMVAAERLRSYAPALQAAGWQRIATVERPTSDEAIALFAPATPQTTLPALPAAVLEKAERKKNAPATEREK